MEEYTNRELGLLLNNLIDKVDVGFRGVHARQDETYSNVVQLLNWQNEREPMLKDICEERKVKKSKLVDIVWEIGRYAVIALFTSVGVLIGIDKLIK